MNIDYPYFVKRALFGRPYFFFNEGPHVIDHIYPSKVAGEKYITKVITDKGTQEGAILSSHEVNTWRPDFVDRGINHDQGGWPKDLNILDEEAVLRFRKKLEREDNYIESMRQLSKPIEHAILQNNAINIYEKYFDDVFKEYSVSESMSQIRNIFRDPNEIMRPVSHLSWCPEGGSHFAASYCNMNFQRMNPLESSELFIWNVEIPSSPETVFDSKIPIVSLEWNPMDKNFLIGGMYTGQIAFYDIRKAPEHVEITTDVVSHRDPVHSVLWINSKTGVDFFSTSADGVVKWWDCRNLSKILDSIILDMSKNQSMTLAYGASCLEYDSSIPAKYLVGTETGHVICGNRKGTSLAEKLPWIMKTHSGPIYSLGRNAGFSKFYLTVADWSARIWSEECKESAIMWTKHYKVPLTAGEWSRSRYSVFFLTRADGYLDLWDLLQEQINPFVSLRVSDRSLTALRVEEQGQLVVVGDETGKCFLIQYAESLATSLKNDKIVLSAMFDRESHREKILETRMREIRLALKLKAMQAEGGSKPTSKTDVVDVEAEEREKAAEEYWSQVNKALELYKEAARKKEEEKGLLEKVIDSEEENLKNVEAVAAAAPSPEKAPDDTVK